jgi:5-methylcytosine-specific restriction protein B
MARFTEYDASLIFDTARNWRDQCLIAGKSLLWQDRELWSPSNLQHFKACFIDRPDTSTDKGFEEKFKAQLALEVDDVTRLACELLFVYFLWPTIVGRSRKAGLICEVAVDVQSRDKPGLRPTRPRLEPASGTSPVAVEVP